MDKKLIARLLGIATLGLAIAGFLLLAICFFTKGGSAWMLVAALACLFLSNLFNIVRISQINKKDK